jgi:hypothetical protein
MAKNVPQTNSGHGNSFSFSRLRRSFAREPRFEWLMEGIADSAEKEAASLHPSLLSSPW